MKKVVLIGDSIRLGYEKYVREALSDVAEVYSPAENCRFAQYVLRNFYDWKKKHEWPDDVDVVHWNAGLWDTITLFEDGTLTPPEFYADTVRRIDKRIRLCYPNAKVIFATSTHVQEDKYLNKKKAARYNADTDKFNRIAIEALEGSGTYIDDLFEVSRNAPESAFSDMTHYNTPEGCELLGGAVVKSICDTLGIDVPEKKVGNAALTEKPLGI